MEKGGGASNKPENNIYVFSPQHSMGVKMKSFLR